MFSYAIVVVNWIGDKLFEVIAIRAINNCVIHKVTSASLFIKVVADGYSGVYWIQCITLFLAANAAEKGRVVITELCAFLAFMFTETSVFHALDFDCLCNYRLTLFIKSSVLQFFKCLSGNTFFASQRVWNSVTKAIDVAQVYDTITEFKVVRQQWWAVVIRPGTIIIGALNAICAEFNFIESVILIPSDTFITVDGTLEGSGKREIFLAIVWNALHVVFIFASTRLRV